MACYRKLDDGSSYLNFSRMFPCFLGVSALLVLLTEATGSVGTLDNSVPSFFRGTQETRMYKTDSMGEYVLVCI